MIALAVASAPLSFERALELADQAPEVAAAQRAAQDRRRIDATVSKLVANPLLSAQAGARAHAGGTGPELFVGLAQPFNLSGLSGSRRRGLDAEYQHDLALGRAALTQSRLRTAAAWLSLWAVQAELAEATREVELATDWAGRVERAAAAGGLTQVDAAAARSWKAEAELARLTAEGNVFSAGVELNRSLGVDSVEPARATAELPPLPDEDGAAIAQSLAGAERAPAAELARHARDAEQARLDEVASANGTWLQLGAHGGREGTGDVIGTATLQLTIPAFDRGEREQARLSAQIDRAEGDRIAAVARARAERVDAIHELEHTRETLTVITRQLVPAAEEAARFAEKRLAAGEGTAFEWVTARRAVLAARSRRMRAQADELYARFAALELAQATEVPR